MVVTVNTRVTGGMDWIRAKGDDRTAIAVAHRELMKPNWLELEESGLSEHEELRKKLMTLHVELPFSDTHLHFMSDYDLRPGGSLKLKGGVAEGGIVKK
jgi:hypothetical protein